MQQLILDVALLSSQLKKSTAPFHYLTEALHSVRSFYIPNYPVTLIDPLRSNIIILLGIRADIPRLLHVTS